MVYLYAVIIAASALMFGVFVRAVMMSLGFVPDFGSGLLLVFGSASVYVLLQASFMGFMRVYQPTKAVSTYVTEMLSNAGVLVLLPYVMRYPISWPADALERVEPLIYLGVCVIIQLIGKMATFFGSHRGALVGRRGVFGYIVVVILSGTASIVLADRWVQSLETARSIAPTETTVEVFGDVHASTRVIPEGATLTESVVAEPGLSITTRWSAGESDPPESVYATFVMVGQDTKVYQDSVSVAPGELSEIRVPNEYVPKDIQQYSLRWTREREPNWQRLLGLRPIVYALPESPDALAPSPLSAIMSGPYEHRERPAARGMNVVLIVIDGLAANHLSMMGYPRSVTPSLDKLAIGGLSYPNGTSFTANSADAIESMLSGRGEIAIRATMESELVSTLLADSGYATVAYTEGTRKGDGLRFGNGIEAGFQEFSDGYDSVTGSRGTVQRAQEWIREHEHIQFFMLLRLSGLTEYLSFDAGEGAVFPEEGGRPTPRDDYDNALLNLDASLGSLLKFIRDYDTRKNTYVMVTAPYGYQFSLDQSGRELSDPSMRVPVIINGPGVRKANVPRQVELADVGATIATVTQVDFSRSIEGRPIN